MSDEITKEDRLIQCHHCGESNDLMIMDKSRFQHPIMPNTLTNLPDHNEVTWLCDKCGCWNNPRD